MKLLVISLDNSILRADSSLGQRVLGYSSLVEKYSVIVPSADRIELTLSEKVKVYGSGGKNKFFQLFHIYKLAKGLLNEYDLVSVQDQYYLALMGWLVAKKFRKKLELQIHGFEKYSGPRKLIARFVIPRAAAIRVVSQRLRKELMANFGVRKEKITVVPIYSELSPLVRQGSGGQANYPPSPRLRRTSELRIKEDTEKFIFLTVGRLVKVKNIGLQIEAMAGVVKKYPNAELWIVGNGLEYKDLKFKIENLKLSRSVKLLGQKSREELEKNYGQADAFLLTSNYEGWGLAVIEAASFSLPIIMTDVGCAGEIIRDGESGLVIPVDDIEALKNSMIKLMENSELRKKLGENAKLAVSQLPNKEQTLNLYKKSWEKAAENKMSAEGGSAFGGKLLIVTQKIDINDDLLGFFHDWVAEFAKNCEQVTVICLENGEYDLPGNVKVLSLGKEAGGNRLKYIFNFYKYIWQERKNYDVVFAHMNPEYVALAGWLWRLLNKKITLWFVHKDINLKLKLAEFFSDIVFTASADSFRLPSRKALITGHGINLIKFKPDLVGRENEIFKILYVGRISPIKNQLLLIKAANVLVSRYRLKDFTIDLIGSSVYRADKEYLLKLKETTKELKLENHINFIGSIPNRKMAEYYHNSRLSINLCPTGGMDKAVLESMACAVPVIVFNKTFFEVFGVYQVDFILKQIDEEELAQKIHNFFQKDAADKIKIGRELNRIVAAKFNLSDIVKKISDEIKKL